MSDAKSVIGQPITFTDSKTAPNRLLKSAMTERLCTWSDENPDECGKPTPEYIRLYEEWGKGGLGVLVLGNIPCDRRYPEAKRNAVIDPSSPWDPVSAFKPVIAACKSSPTPPIVVGQITHAGRQTSKDIAPTPVSASDVQSPPLGGMEFGKPRPMTEEEIHDTVRRFAYAAGVLKKAGADGAQLHSAHGYLLSQFLSPRVNKRTDKYGGSLENRSRIVFEIIEAIKAEVKDPSFVISIKINSADFSEGGFSEEESAQMCKLLEAAGVSLIELSGGTYESLEFRHLKESTKKREAFFIEFAERFRPHLTKAKLAVTGGFRSAKGMAAAISEGTCDLAGLARPLTAEPYLPVALTSGAADRAKPNLVNEQMQIFASYYQLGEIGQGREPGDFSDEKTAKQLEEDIMRDSANAAKFRPKLKEALGM